MYLLIGLLNLIIFVELGNAVKDGPTAFDSTVAQWFKAHRNPSEYNWAQIVTAFTTPLIVCVALVVLLLFRQYWMGAWTPVDFVPLALVICAGAVSLWAKPFFGRIRPGLGLATQFDLEPSYPSSHVVFIALAGGCLLFVYSRRRALTVLLIIFATANVAVVRLMLGVHWFTDVVGAMFMSTGMFYLFKFIESSLEERERVK